MSSYDDLEARWVCDDPEREALEHDFNARFDRWDGWDRDGFDESTDDMNDTRWLDDNESADYADFEQVGPDVPVRPIVLGRDDIPF